MSARHPSRCFFAPADFEAGRAASGAGGFAFSSPPVLAATLDADALDRLRELDPTGINRLLERVFQAFTSSTDRLLPQMHAAFRSGDQAGVRHVVHTLKSSSASIGATKLSRLCAEIEARTQLDAFDDLADQLEQMDREAALVLQALKQVRGVPS